MAGQSSVKREKSKKRCIKHELHLKLYNNKTERLNGGNL